jgi:hypothetical protein
VVAAGRHRASQLRFSKRPVPPRALFPVPGRGCCVRPRTTARRHHTRRSDFVSRRTAQPGITRGIRGLVSRTAAQPGITCGIRVLFSAPRHTGTPNPSKTRLDPAAREHRSGFPVARHERGDSAPRRSICAVPRHPGSSSRTGRCLLPWHGSQAAASDDPPPARSARSGPPLTFESRR